MDAILARRIEAKQIEDETADDGEVGPGVFDAGAHLVVIQHYIKTQPPESRCSPKPKQIYLPAVTLQLEYATAGPSDSVASLPDSLSVAMPLV